MATFTRGRALVIGVGAYADSRWNVPTATRDAEALAAALRAPDAGGYEPARVDMLLDTAATRVGIAQALALLADRSTSETVVLISFTGHGALGDDGLYYLATSDTRFTDAGIVGGTGFSITSMAETLRSIRARQVLLVVNACFSGNLARLSQGDLAPRGSVLPEDEARIILASGDGRAIITASKPDQFSYIPQGATHSYFGQALLDALRGGVGDGTSGYVGLFELYEAVHAQVRNATSRASLSQEPALTLVQGVGPFPVALYKGASSGNEQMLSRQPPAGAVNAVPFAAVLAVGTGATAVKAERGSTVTIDNSKLIDFGGATIMGNVRTGNVVKGDLTIIGGVPAAPTDEEAEDPLQRLPLLRARVAVARNVDTDDRDLAVLKLDQAHRALEERNSAKARQRINEALVTLRAMNNGYINSVTRKLEELMAGL